MRIVITGGKTGGHVFPALAVVESLLQSQRESRLSKSGEDGSDSLDMSDLLYVGYAGGIEDQAVLEAGIPLLSLSLATPDSVRNRLRFFLSGSLAVIRCMRRFRLFGPTVVFSTGGFVSLPGSLAAWFTRVPIVVYVPDARPGKTVRFTKRLARSVAVTSEETAALFGDARAVSVTGYPVRAVFRHMKREPARKALGLGDSEPQLLVMGGSQGSAAINRAVADILPALLPWARVLHVCGPQHLAELETVWESLPFDLRERYRLVATLDGERMAEAMFASDVAITRAGASVLGELPAASLPAILIPLPINAQDANAAALERHGAAVVLPQERLVSGELEPVVRSLLQDSDRREAMRAALIRLRRPDAADRIAELILDAGDRAA